MIQSKYQDVIRGYKPKEIIHKFQKEFGINLWYGRVWRAQEAALSMVRRSAKESYALIARYGEKLKIANPETHYDLEVDPNGHFRYMYMTLGASIQAFFYCIRLGLVVDSSYCNGKYKSIMLVVMSIGANKRVYPVSFELSDKKNNES